MRRYLSLFFSLTFGLLVIAACNGNGGGGSFSVSLSSGTLTVEQGGSDSLTVTVSPSGGFSDPVNLSVSNLPNGVSESFSANPVPGGSGSSTLTLTVAASAPTGTTTVSVEGSSGGTTDTATFDLTVNSSTVNISGTVVDLNQQPVANTPVAIVGATSTTTDATGNFSFSNVTTPYDLAVAVSTSNEVVVYQGLTRNDPTVLFIGTAPSAGNANTADVQGTVSAGSGGQFPEPTPGDTKAAFGSPDASDTYNVDPATGSYPQFGTATVNWFGSSSIAGTLHALQWDIDPANGFPTNYTGYGDTSLTLQAGGSFSSPTTDITLAGVSNATFDGSLASLPTASSGPYALTSKGLAADFGNQATIGLLNDPSTSTSFSYTTPNLSGANARFFASAGAAPTGSSGTLNTITISTNAIDASGVTVELFAAPELSLPADNASGIGASSTFQWSPFDSGVYVVQFTSANGPNYFVITDDTQTTLPELANIAGFNLPSSTSYDWEVLGYAPFASTDDTAEPGFFGSFLQTSDVRLGTSGSRSFTTQ